MKTWITGPSRLVGVREHGIPYRQQGRLRHGRNRVKRIFGIDLLHWFAELQQDFGIADRYRADNDGAPRHFRRRTRWVSRMEHSNPDATDLDITGAKGVDINGNK